MISSRVRPLFCIISALIVVLVATPTIQATEQGIASNFTGWDEDFDFPIVSASDLDLLDGSGDTQADAFGVGDLDEEDEHVGEKHDVLCTEIECEPDDDRKSFLIRLFFGSHYQSAYNKINKFLRQKLPEVENPTQNINEAIQWVTNEEKKSFKKSFAQKNLIEALNQFTALIWVTRNKCTAKSISILKRNDRSTNGRVRAKNKNFNALNRVERVIYKYSLKHAQDCQYVYPTKLDQLERAIDARKLKKVEYMLDPIIREHVAQSPIKAGKVRTITTTNKDLLEVMAMYEEFVSNRPYISSNEDAKALQASLKSLAEEKEDKIRIQLLSDSSANKADQDTAMDELWKKYIVEPCEEYIDKLGREVFHPARYDAMLVDRKFKDMDATPELQHYYLSWSRYRVCESLLAGANKYLLTEVQSLFVGE